jgi:RNA polymerase sigma-70 factor, ECF subfamily
MLVSSQMPVVGTSYDEASMEGLVDDRHNHEPVPPGPGSSNDPHAVLRVLIDEHSGAMFRVAKSLVHDNALAEDVVQESLLKAWQAIGSFRGESSMRSWVLRITQNTAISLLRKRREDVRDPILVPEVIDLVGQTDRQAASRAMLTDLWAALEQLEPLSRTIVVLRELEGLSYEEIGDVLGLPLPTIKTRLFRARRSLATVLEEWR